MGLILITNDDGINSVSLLLLKRGLERKFGDLFRVVIVAPSHERSGSSSSISINKPIKVEKLKEDIFSVHGTPVDCVNISLLGGLIDKRPNLVISGINNGLNVGGDLIYSGTVAASREAFGFGISALSVSQEKNGDFEKGVEVLLWLMERVIFKLEKNPFFYNINIPYSPDFKYKLTKPGKIRYRTPVRRLDEETFLIGGVMEVDLLDDETDVVAVKRGYVSLTPLKYDLTTDEVAWRY